MINLKDFRLKSVVEKLKRPSCAFIDTEVVPLQSQVSHPTLQLPVVQVTIVDNMDNIYTLFLRTPDIIIPSDHLLEKSVAKKQSLPLNKVRVLSFQVEMNLLEAALEIIKKYDTIVSYNYHRQAEGHLHLGLRWEFLKKHGKQYDGSILLRND